MDVTLYRFFAVGSDIHWFPAGAGGRVAWTIASACWLVVSPGTSVIRIRPAY